MEVNEFWIPVVMFIGLAVVLSLWVWFRFKGKREMQVTLRSAIEKGQDLSPELIENLINPPASPQRDLRRGVIGVVIAIGFALFGAIWCDTGRRRRHQAVAWHCDVSVLDWCCILVNASFRSIQLDFD
jgi:hypothetical protein